MPLEHRDYFTSKDIDEVSVRDEYNCGAHEAWHLRNKVKVFVDDWADVTFIHYRRLKEYKAAHPEKQNFMAFTFRGRIFWVCTDTAPYRSTATKEDPPTCVTSPLPFFSRCWRR